VTKEIHTASCLCGNITLKATGDAKYTEYCHCAWCQKSSGSAFLPWVVFNRDNVQVTCGNLSYFHTGPNTKRGFCKDCGSAMSFHTDKNFDIALGVMDNPNIFKASQHIWVKSQIGHIQLRDDLPKFTRSSD